MEKPIEPITAAGGVPTWAVAVIVVAPRTAVAAEFKVTVATPEALVKAVEGMTVAWAASVLKVMTELATAAPPASLNVAFTVAGAPAPTEIEVTAAPVLASVSAIVIVGTAVVAVVPVVSDETGLPPDPPEPQPASTPSAIAKKSDDENLEIPWWIMKF